MLSPKQELALTNSVKRINLLEGCVRSGKTHVANLLFIEQIATIPYDKFLLTGRTKEALWRNVTEDLIKLIGSDYCHYDSVRGHLSVRLGDEKKTIYCIGANDKKSLEKIQGGTFGGWYGDERLLQPEEFADMARTRCSIPNSRIIWTCNPGSPYHPIHKNYILKREEKKDLFHLHFTLDDNPSLTEEFKTELKTTFSGVFYKRMIEGLWVLAEGLIFDSFHEGLIVEEDPECSSYWCAVDYGTGSTTVVLLFGEGNDGNIYILDEWVWDAEEERKQLSNPEMVEELKEFLENYFGIGNPNPVYKVYPDPSAASYKVELQQAGFCIGKTDNDVISGIRSVSSGFFKGTLRIHKRCTSLIEEISTSYIWDPNAKLRGEDRPLKRNDHRSDTMRYGYYSYVKFGRTGSSHVSSPEETALTTKLSAHHEQTQKRNIITGRLVNQWNRLIKRQAMCT